MGSQDRPQMTCSCNGIIWKGEVPKHLPPPLQLQQRVVGSLFRGPLLSAVTGLPNLTGSKTERCLYKHNVLEPQDRIWSWQLGAGGHPFFHLEPNSQPHTLEHLFRLCSAETSTQILKELNKSVRPFPFLNPRTLMPVL